MTNHTSFPRRLTDGHANDQLLYFTSSSLTEDDALLVFISDLGSPIPKATDPTAHVNLHVLDRRTGQRRALTRNTEGYLRSYVYFEGLRHRGLGLASPSLHPATGDVYYVQGDELRCVNARNGSERTLARLPADHVTAFTHVSTDGLRVCVPTIHESAFDVADLKNIDANVQHLGLSSHLRIIDTRSGALVEDIEVPCAWITHVQVHPQDPRRILFNHEWPSDCGIRRIWLWDGAHIRRLRDEGINANKTRRTRADWVCHEVWSPDGKYILYHGAHVDASGQQHAFVGRMEADGSSPIEINFPTGFNRYGHFTCGRQASTLVSDGYYEATPEIAALYPLIGPPRATHGWGGHWISTLEVDWDATQISWSPRCRHNSSWESQDAHPHPVFNHAGNEVLFTSDGEGRRAIYALPT